MKESIIILLLFSTAYPNYGFETSTKVRIAQHSYKCIDQVAHSTFLAGYTANYKQVSSFVMSTQKQTSPLIVKIYFKDTFIICGLSQKIYCHNRKKLLKAEEFTIYDALLDMHGNAIKIQRVTILKQDHELYILHCTAPHTYAVSDYNILVHNQEFSNHEFLSTVVNVLNKTQSVNATGIQGVLFLLTTKLIEYAGVQSLLISMPFVGWLAAAIASSYYLYYWTTHHVVPALQLWWCPTRKRFIIHDISQNINSFDCCWAQAIQKDNLIAHTHNC